MRRYNCPSCGAPIGFQAGASIMAICAYCRSTVIRRDLDVESIGKMAELQEDGSVLQLQAGGRYNKVHFGMVGRIQLRYEQGYWNEWYLLFDDMKTGWLSEAQGHYAITFGTPAPETLLPFDQWALGQEIELNRQYYEVTEILSARCVSGEGELPFTVGSGYETPLVDLVGAGGICATIDYGDDPPRVYTGEYVAFEELQFSGLKQIEGW